jgi:hypothetical protein
MTDDGRPGFDRTMASVGNCRTPAGFAEPPSLGGPAGSVILPSLLLQAPLGDPVPTPLGSRQRTKILRHFIVLEPICHLLDT